MISWSHRAKAAMRLRKSQTMGEGDLSRSVSADGSSIVSARGRTYRQRAWPGPPIVRRQGSIVQGGSIVLHAKTLRDHKAVDVPHNHHMFLRLSQTGIGASSLKLAGRSCDRVSANGVFSVVPVRCRCLVRAHFPRADSSTKACLARHQGQPRRSDCRTDWFRKDSGRFHGGD
jgi:hypothetical protein